MHAWTPAYIQQLESYEALRRLQEQGKIRFFGISSNDWDLDGRVGAVPANLVDTVQVIYNVFEQRSAEELFPACREHNVAVIARSV
ncbi:MAG: hypothetical protein C4289_03155 [Chloroflexota bacterium]